MPPIDYKEVSFPVCTIKQTCDYTPSFRTYQLLEDPILVSQPVSPERELLGGRRIEVTRRKTTKTSVAQCGITLFVEKVFEVEPELVDAFIVLLFETQVQKGIVEGSSHEEFER